MSKERWRSVSGYGGRYEVSSEGNVRSLDRKVLNRGVLATIRGRIMRPRIGKSKGDEGRRRINLAKAGKKTTFRISVLVLRAFVGKRPDGYQCCHNNGDPSDNRLKNLRYDTPKGNSADRFDHGTVVAGEDHPQSKLTLKQVQWIRKQYTERHLTCASLGRKFGVNESTIRSIIKGRTWPFDENDNLQRPGNRGGLKENQKLARAKRYEAFSKKQTLARWAEESGINRSTIHHRVHRIGWSVEDAVSIPTNLKRRRQP